MVASRSDSKTPRSVTGRAESPPRRKRNRAGRPTADELDRRKLRVMEVATDMFVARGYAATTLIAIAKKAGVATRTLYQHFGDKEDIFREVIFARDIAIIDPPVLEEGEDVMAALRKAAQYSHDLALRKRSIALMRLMIAESGRFPELISMVATKTFTRFTHNVARVFHQLAEKGLIPEGDHARSAELFVDLLLGNRTVMVYFGGLSAAPSEKDIEVKIDLFINGRFSGLAAANSSVRVGQPDAKLVKAQSERHSNESANGPKAVVRQARAGRSGRPDAIGALSQQRMD